MKDFKEKAEEFEQMNEEQSTREALEQFYAQNAWQILGGIATLGILIFLAQSNLPVWARGLVVLGLLGANYLFSYVKGESIEDA